MNYHGVADCKHQKLPVAGVYDKTVFSVTATNPAPGKGSCATYFSYSLTIQ